MVESSTLSNNIKSKLSLHGSSSSSSRHSITTLSINNAFSKNNENDDDQQLDYLVYSSHGIVNLATSCKMSSNLGDSTEPSSSSSPSSTLITTVEKTLRSNRTTKHDAIITALTRIDSVSIHHHHHHNDSIQDDSRNNHVYFIATGYSNGGISIWYCHPPNQNHNEHPDWNEIILLECQDSDSSINTNTTKTTTTAATTSINSITDISGIYHKNDDLLVLSTATAHGLHIYQLSIQSILLLQQQQKQQQEQQDKNINYSSHFCYKIPKDQLNVQKITKCGSLASVLVTTRSSPYCYQKIPNDSSKNSNEHESTTTATTTTTVETLIFCGTALPRYNKIWVYTSASSYSSYSSPTSLHQNKLGINHYAPFVSQGFLIGHEDWITCLSWKPLLLQSKSNSNKSVVEPNYFLASGSHDARIRLWKFQPSLIIASHNQDDNDDDKVNDDDDVNDDDENVANDNDEENEELLDTLLEEEGEARLIMKNLVNQSNMAITLEALLFGHEESITSLAWKPSPKSKSKNNNNNNNDDDDDDELMEENEKDLCIISSSMDKSILLWSPDEAEEGIWIPTARVGSAGGILGGSIGSSLLGFLNVSFWQMKMEDLMIVGVGFGGSIHFWKMTPASHPNNTNEIIAQDDDNEKDVEVVEDPEDEDQVWEALPCLTGHFKGVSDLDWEANNGEYLLTVSYDQTCRLWSEVNVMPNKNDKDSSTTTRWMEVGRPQVHGYDLNAITCMGGIEGGREPSHRFVSGADEKQLRAFDAPVATLRLVHGLQSQNTYQPQPGINQDNDGRVERAYIPSLGLSNKGMVTTEKEMKLQEEDQPSDDLRPASDVDSIQLPLERDLGVTTLWPEVRKLYGHGSELVCLASSSPFENEGAVLVASACKARDVEHASIRLWDVESGICLDVLKGGHRSTVATLSFSSNGIFLASSGKDRRLCIWKKNSIDESETKVSFNLAAAVDSAHKRIVWSVNFCPHDSTILVSGGRDGVVKIWKIIENDEDNLLEMKELHRFEPSSKEDGKKNVSVTAVSFSPIPITFSDGKEHAVLAVGLESGLIELWTMPMITMDKVELLQNMHPSNCHVAAVKKLAWRPCGNESEGGQSKIGKKLTLSSCGLDHGVRIFDIFFTCN